MDALTTLLSKAWLSDSSRVLSVGSSRRVRTPAASATAGLIGAVLGADISWRKNGARSTSPIGPTVSLGAWVELQVHGRWTRMQLTWASPRGNLFMFTGVKGSTHSMTRHSLDQLLQDGTLRVFSDQAVVDSALDAVAQTAMRNSVDVTS